MNNSGTSPLELSRNKVLFSLGAVAFWLLLGCLFLAQAYFYALSTGQAMDWARQVPYRLSGYLVWGLLTLPLWILFCRVENRYRLKGAVLIYLACAVLTGILHRLLGTLTEFVIRLLAFGESASLVAFFEVRKIALIGGSLDSGITFLVIILAFAAMSTVLRNQRQRRQIQKIQQQLTQSQLDALQSQLQPHFLFNTLNGIVAAIHAAPQKAESMVTQLANILRFSLDNSRQQTVELTEEFRILEDYLNIEKARLGERINFQISVAAECQKLHVPPLICQPLVENAVRHGIAPFNRPGQLRIDARMEQGNLAIIIEDSGSLFDGEAEKGVGLSNCKARLKVLFHESATLQFSQSQLGGTKVEVMLPIVAPGSAIGALPSSGRLLP